MNTFMNKLAFSVIAIMLVSAFFLPQNAYAQERLVSKPDSVRIIKYKTNGGGRTTYDHELKRNAVNNFTHLVAPNEQIEIHYRYGRSLIYAEDTYQWYLYPGNETPSLIIEQTTFSLPIQQIHGFLLGNSLSFMFERTHTTYPFGEPSYTTKEILFTVEFNIVSSTIDAVLGDKSSDLSVYPNPVSETLFINAPVSNEDGANANTLVLSSESGKMVKTLQLNESKTEINVSGLDNGRYILRMEDNAGKLIDYKHITVKH